MIELYRTRNRNLRQKVEILLKRILCRDVAIERTAAGKPFIAGNPVYFSLSHCKDKAIIALSDRPVGVDLELFDRRRDFTHILARFSERERAEIGQSAAAFYAHWTVREAYIKMCGGTLSHDLKKLEYYENGLYYDGLRQDCGIALRSDFEAGVVALCAEDFREAQLRAAACRRFRLRKDEFIG